MFVHYESQGRHSWYKGLCVVIPTFAFRGSSDQVRCVPSLNKTSLLHECNTDMEIVTTYRIAPSRKKVYSMCLAQ